VRILLTGAGGFIGRALAGALPVAGHEVVPLTRRTRGTPGEIIGDLTDPATFARLPARVDAIVHAAAYVPERESTAELAQAMASNAEATLRLLEYARNAGVRRFVHISSAAIYGVPMSPGAVAEDTEPRPDNAYALSKLAAELMLEPYHFVYGINTVALRPWS
jgi:nucleoside-diphosphate-sugar epimerase